MNGFFFFYPADVSMHYPKSNENQCFFPPAILLYSLLYHFSGFKRYFSHRFGLQQFSKFSNDSFQSNSVKVENQEFTLFEVFHPRFDGNIAWTCSINSRSLQRCPFTPGWDKKHQNLNTRCCYKRAEKESFLAAAHSSLHGWNKFSCQISGLCSSGPLRLRSSVLMLYLAWSVFIFLMTSTYVKMMGCHSRGQELDTSSVV